MHFQHWFWGKGGFFGHVIKFSIYFGTDCLCGKRSLNEPRKKKRKEKHKSWSWNTLQNVFCGLQCIIVHYLSHCWYLGKKNSRIKETIKRHYFRNIGCCIEILRQIINKTKRIIKLNVCKTNFYLTSTILIEGMEESPECQYCFAVMDYFGEN